jgi:lipopolysaccharide transport system ATP-binding protein
MSNLAIHIDQLSKQYRLGVIGGKRLVDDVSRWWARVNDKPDPLSRIGHEKVQKVGAAEGDEYIWALKDISIDIKHGEVLGIIGRNGAGKSTLLKILSRVTGPTSGQVKVSARIASLLEVGTGFHPELSGRENVFLNGAILGMSKSEIKRKFDEIVSFAGVEKFIDTPVKRYSSGMHVRLGFAVAAHLDPEILIVDEVLSVGDTAFREKCLGKMQQVNRTEGRTVLFVSHDMATVESLCKRGIVLEGGEVAFDGDISGAINRHLKPEMLSAVVDQLNDRTRQGIGGARILSIRFEDGNGNPRTHFKMGDSIEIVVRAEFHEPIENPTFAVNILTDRGVLATACCSSHYGVKTGVVKGLFEYRTRIDGLTLYPRTYVVEPWIATAAGTPNLDWVRDGATFVVTLGPEYMKTPVVGAHHGISFTPSKWDVRQIADDVAAYELILPVNEPEFQVVH